MINRDMQSVYVITYSSTVDSYGQRKLTISSTRTVDMALYLFDLKEVQDPRYNDCEMLGITKDNTITDSNEIKTLDDIEYQIIRIIPSRRYYQVLLRKKK